MAIMCSLVLVFVVNNCRTCGSASASSSGGWRHPGDQGVASGCPLGLGAQFGQVPGGHRVQVEHAVDFRQPSGRAERPGECLTSRPAAGVPGQQAPAVRERPPGRVPQQGRAEPAALPVRADHDVQAPEVLVVPERQLKQVPARHAVLVGHEPGFPRVTHPAGLQPPFEHPSRHHRNIRIIRHPGRVEDLVAGRHPPRVPRRLEPLNAHNPSEPNSLAPPPPVIRPSRPAGILLVDPRRAANTGQHPRASSAR